MRYFDSVTVYIARLVFCEAKMADSASKLAHLVLPKTIIEETGINVGKGAYGEVVEVKVGGLRYDNIIWPAYGSNVYIIQMRWETVAQCFTGRPDWQYSWSIHGRMLTPQQTSSPKYCAIDWCTLHSSQGLGSIDHHGVSSHVTHTMS